MIIENPVILIVDDSENDALLMRVGFKRAGFSQPLHFAIDGDDAIAYLQGAGDYADRARFPLPTVVLMDLNMPRKDGFETLQWIRGVPALRGLNVNILSASSRPEDIVRAYDLGANAYLLKPGTFDGLVEIARVLLLWLRTTQCAP
ncbi:MAG TPA: response regulator [Rariglobus sp.]